MIFDIERYFSMLSEEITWQRNGMSHEIRHVESTWPTFRNISYPFSATPLILTPYWNQQHQTRITQYMQLLEKTIHLCAKEEAISEYLGHSSTERQFLLTPSGQLHIMICRLDGYIRRDNGTLVILENNSDSPAGIFFTPRLNALICEIWQKFGQQELNKNIAEKQFNSSLFTQNFFYRLAQHPQPTMIILQEAGKSNAESQEMARTFSATGLPTRVCDPGEIEIKSDGIYVEETPVAIIWNKINTVYWRQYLRHNPKEEEKWLCVVKDKNVVHLNHFGARIVTENKRFLALWQEPYFMHLLTETERALVQELLPWASKLEPNKTVNWQGRTHDLFTLAINNRRLFVIKEPYDIRGDGVTIGLSISQPAWEKKLEEATAEGFILQEYIPPFQLPVVHINHWSHTRICNLSLDTFLFAGKVVGYGAKASPENKVNLFQGGQKISVLVGADTRSRAGLDV